MSFVFLERIRIDEQIIEVRDHEIVEILPKYVVNEVLERARSIAKTEGHHLVFVEPIATAKSRLPFFSTGHPKAIVTISHVEFREPFRLADSSEDFADERERVTIFDSDSIKSTVIDT